jgi:hypothetical protein
METQLIKQETTPSSLLQQAIEKGLGVEELSKLMDLQERWEKNQARKLFFEAFTEFQSKCPDLRKTKEVKFDTKTGGQTNYKYAPLADITRQISQVLKQCFLSYRWEIQDNANEIKVTCLVSHVDGHTERTTMQANPDTSGSKNAIQARGSAIEYLKRYTHIGALGISTADSDIDGRLPEIDIDKLHKDYMAVYSQVIQIDETLTKYEPSNWKMEPTAKGYIKATGELRKILFELQNKKS